MERDPANVAQTILSQAIEYKYMHVEVKTNVAGQTISFTLTGGSLAIHTEYAKKLVDIGSAHGYNDSHLTIGSEKTIVTIFPNPTE